MATSTALAKWKAATRKALLADAEARFWNGDRSGLWDAIIATAAGREPLPEWARQGLRFAIRRLNEGHAQDLNEVLGWNNRKGAHQTVRAAGARYRRYASEVLQKLTEYRHAGKGMTAETFEEIATTFNVGRSLVQRVYNEYKAAVMNVIPGSPGGRTTAVFLMDYWEWDDSPQIQFPWLLKAILDDAERAAKRVQRKQKTSA